MAEKVTFGEVDSMRKEWEEFKAKVEKILAENPDIDIHSMMLFVGLDDDKGNDRGATICTAGCPVCLVPNVIKEMREFCVRSDEHEAKKGYH